MIQSALKTKCNFVQVFSNLQKQEVISLVFLISQFGDALLSEIPPEYSYFDDIPYIIEWNDGVYMIPFEVLDLSQLLTVTPSGIKRPFSFKL